MRWMLITLSLMTVLMFQNCSPTKYYSVETGTIGASKTEADPVMNSQEERSPADDGSLAYVCILEGNGKSVHLGYLDENLANDVDAPDAVCMSKYACEEIVSKKFAVISAEKRGFCPNKNPQVVAIPNDDLKKLIDKL